MKYDKYEAYPSARFWVWHHSGWVKLTLKARPSCVKCGGWLNQNPTRRTRQKTLSMCIECEHKQMAVFQDSLAFGFSKPDEEGYSFESSTFIYEKGRYEPPHVVEEWENGGRDCDGTISRSGRLVCPLDRLQAVAAFHPQNTFNGVLIRRPDWQKQGREHVYDQYAQAAGY